MKRQIAGIKLDVRLGDRGTIHDELKCEVSRNGDPDCSDDGFVKAKSVRLEISGANADRDFPIQIWISADSALRLAAEMLDWLAPHGLLHRHGDSDDE